MDSWDSARFLRAFSTSVRFRFQAFAASRPLAVILCRNDAASRWPAPTQLGRWTIIEFENGDDMQFQSQLAQYYFEKYVLEVAIATLEKSGSISKLDTYQFLPPTDDWKFPKYPSRTVISSPQIDLLDELKNFILTNEPFLRAGDCWLGTWIDPQTQQFYFDITTSHDDLDEARTLALELGNRQGRKIVALYNSKRNEIVYL